MDDVPDAAAINEAVELAKGYEEPETVSFINGILGSFMREEKAAASPDRPFPGRTHRRRGTEMDQSLTVTQLNQYLKQRMDADPVLSAVAVRGELSNYKVYPSGHHYFTLKDGESSLRCVMFRSYAQRLRFRPENGLGVLAAGHVSVYPRDGA